jgi:hypothetical protein
MSGNDKGSRMKSFLQAIGARPIIPIEGDTADPDLVAEATEQMDAMVSLKSNMLEAEINKLRGAADELIGAISKVSLQQQATDSRINELSSNVQQMLASTKKQTTNEEIMEALRSNVDLLMKILKRDISTSIRVQKFEVSASNTKLGPERITREVPNLTDKDLRNLDENGIIRVGAEVEPGDVLVGKITPKAEYELAPEERLIQAIFGEYPGKSTNTSLIVPPGVTGVVIDVEVPPRKSDPEEELSAAERLRHAEEQIRTQYNQTIGRLREGLVEALSNVLLGEMLPFDVISSADSEIIIPANRKITKTLVRKLAFASKHVQIASSPVAMKIMEIIAPYQNSFAELEDERERKLSEVNAGKGATNYVLKEAKVYIAMKQRLGVANKPSEIQSTKSIHVEIERERST